MLTFRFSKPHNNSRDSTVVSRCLLCEHKDLSLIPQTCNPGTGGAEAGESLGLACHQPSQPDFQVQRETLSQTMSWKATEEDAQCPSSVSTDAQAHTYICTYNKT